MYAMQMACFTNFNTKIVKQCLVSTGVMLHGKNVKLKRKIFYNRSTHLLVILSSGEKTRICFFLNLLCSHPIWVFSVFPISPSGIGNYRNWSIKRRGAHFIFRVKGAAPIRERPLFQLHVKQKGECRETSELGKKKDKYAHL